jgi:pimeloyl-ACP methyl ester carboxylesterase
MIQRKIKRYVLSTLLALGFFSAQAQELSARFIQIDLGREYGFFSKSAAVLRAVSVESSQAPSKTALLFFSGWPGILWLPENPNLQRMLENTRSSQFYTRKHIDFVLSQGITMVSVDCPTDQWGTSQRSPDPYGCSDTYRSSEQHAKDVLRLIEHLKEHQGIEKIFIMGHSYGSVSSRWLAIRLGSQIQGSIHAASMSQVAGPRFADYGSSVWRMDMSQASAPWVFMHNEQDQCKSTEYSAAAAVAKDRLMTIRGGLALGDPCGGGHYHSFQGRELEALGAVVKWINTGVVTPISGAP